MQIVRERNMLRASPDDKAVVGPIMSSLGKPIKRSMFTLPRIWSEIKQKVGACQPGIDWGNQGLGRSGLGSGAR